MKMTDRNLTLRVLDKTYAVCSLSKGEEIPVWALSGDFLSITKTEEELSIVCEEKNVRQGIKYEGNWRILKIEGPLGFSLVGILAKIANIMSENNISIFAISTYDTDYILIKQGNINKSVEVLKKENYNVI